MRLSEANAFWIMWMGSVLYKVYLLWSRGFLFLCRTAMTWRQPSIKRPSCWDWCERKMQRVAAK